MYEKGMDKSEDVATNERVNVEASHNDKLNLLLRGNVRCC